MGSITTLYTVRLNTLKMLQDLIFLYLYWLYGDLSQGFSRLKLSLKLLVSKFKLTVQVGAMKKWLNNNITMTPK